MKKKTLILLRGCSGAGKSTWAEQFKLEQRIKYKNWVEIVSADNYFIREDKIYRWNRDDLPHAHRWCRDRAEAILKEMNEWYNGLANEHQMPEEDYYLIVDNTN